MTPITQRVIVAGIIIRNKKALIIKRSSDEEIYPNYWELPSGKVRYGEDPNMAVMREVEEETSIKVRPIKPLNINHFSFEEPENRHNIQINYLVEDEDSESKVKLSEAHEEFAWISIEEMDDYNLFEDNKISIKLALKESH